MKIQNIYECDIFIDTKLVKKGEIAEVDEKTQEVKNLLKYKYIEKAE